MTLPQHVEPGGAQMRLLSHVRQTRSAEQATAPQQEDPDGLHTGRPPQLSSTKLSGQPASANCWGRNAAHAATAVTASARCTQVMVCEFLPRAARLSTCAACAWLDDVPSPVLGIAHMSRDPATIALRRPLWAPIVRLRTNTRAAR